MDQAPGHFQLVYREKIVTEAPRYISAILRLLEHSL